MREIIILGSTGSIGRQALEVVDQFPDKFKVLGLAAATNVQLLAQQVEKYQPRYLSIGSAEDAHFLKERIGQQKEVFWGPQGLNNLAQIREADLILIAVSGINGLQPTLTALENKITVALANKETMVTAGSLVMQKAQEFATAIIPVDSEHSALLQCWEKENTSAVEKLILTASGGPFLNATPEELAHVSPQMALQHPNWQMGAKITIDSASLVNKGLEVIEAHWLFEMPYEKIEIVIHPESIIHSLVQYQDGVLLAQLGCPDMRVPLQYAFAYPQRYPNRFPRVDLSEIAQLTFQKPDLDRFPGLSLALAAGTTGGTLPTVFNAANEVAVQLFLKGCIKFNEIPQIIERVMSKHEVSSTFQLEDILRIDQWARLAAQKAI